MKKILILIIFLSSCFNHKDASKVFLKRYDDSMCVAHNHMMNAKSIPEMGYWDQKMNYYQYKYDSIERITDEKETQKAN